MAEFWSLTFREIHHVMNGAAAAKLRDLDIAYYTAWHSGLFSQPFGKGKFPDYRRHAPRARGPVRQTAAHQKMIILQLHKAFGGELIQKDI
jgi:hypothetical protein